MPEFKDCMTTAPSMATGDGADTAGERGAADDGSRDGVELVERALRIGRGVQAGVEIAAATAQSAPISANMRTDTHFTLMPASSAASGFPPMAKT